MILHPAHPVDAIPSCVSGQVEATKISPVALSGGVAEIQTITAVAFASHAQGDYFVFSNAAGYSPASLSNNPSVISAAT